MVPLLGTEFVPKADFSETTLSFYTPVGSSMEATEAKARQVETIVREFPEVRYTLSTINTGNASRARTTVAVYVRLVDRKDRKRSVDQMATVLRERLRQVPGITVTHVGLLDTVGGNKQVEFSLQGPDLRELDRLTRLVMDKIRPIPGLVDLDSSVKADKPTLDVEVRRDAASDLGLNTWQIGSQLRTLVAGVTVGNWRAPDDQTYDVNVRLAPGARNAPEDLQRLPFTVGTNADGSPRIVRLNQVATVRETSTGAQPDQPARPHARGGHQRQRGQPLGRRGVGRHPHRAGQCEFPTGLPLPVRRLHQEHGRSRLATPSRRWCMAIVFIYMILASQFKSFLQPLALMTALPLTLIGVVLALLMFRSTLSMFSIIGVVMLMGLVTKNAILLVDFAIRSREDTVDASGERVPGLERTQALLLAAKVRLRPILMTTLAMIFGMVPLAFALTEGSEQRAPMGQAVIGGVITSSLLTLVVVPVVYCYMDDLAGWFKRRFGPQTAAPGPVKFGTAP